MDAAPSSEWLPPDAWCPGCLPDPPTALGSALAYCCQHQPSMFGCEDAKVVLEAVHNWADAGGTASRAIQADIT